MGAFRRINVIHGMNPARNPTERTLKNFRPLAVQPDTFPVALLPEIDEPQIQSSGCEDRSHRREGPDTPAEL
jgi:hypothetical protein